MNDVLQALREMSAADGGRGDENVRFWAEEKTAAAVWGTLKVKRIKATERHLPYGITQCYLTQVNAPHYNLSHAGRYSIYLPRREGWKAELTLVLAIYWDGLPVCRQSRVGMLIT